jgi:hypothetical protein
MLSIRAALPHPIEQILHSPKSAAVDGDRAMVAGDRGGDAGAIKCEGRERSEGGGPAAAQVVFLTDQLSGTLREWQR